MPQFRGQMVEDQGYPATFEGWLSHFLTLHYSDEYALDLQETQPLIDQITDGLQLLSLPNTAESIAQRTTLKNQFQISMALFNDLESDFPNAQTAHSVNNSYTENYNLPIAMTFPVMAQRCSLVIDQLLMDHYTSSGGIWTNDACDYIIYVIWQHQTENAQQPGNLNAIHIRCVKTLWKCLWIAMMAPQ